MLRNPEVRRCLLLCVPLGAAVTVVITLLDWRAGLLAGALCLAFLLIYLADARRRYRNMARLADDLDAVLHGRPGVTLSQYTDGEVSLLRSQLQKLVVRLSEQAAQLQQEKSQLAEAMADISHQIRTPLTAVNLLLAGLSEPEAGEDAREAVVFALRRQMERIDWLVNSLLKLAWLDAGTVRFLKESVSLSELIRRAAEPLSILMEVKGQSLRVPAEGNAVCDPQWTAEALGNILKSARSTWRRVASP